MKFAGDYISIISLVVSTLLTVTVAVDAVIRGEVR